MINAKMISKIKQTLLKFKKYFSKLMINYSVVCKKFMKYLENLIKIKMVIKFIQVMFQKMNYKITQKKRKF